MSAYEYELQLGACLAKRLYLCAQHAINGAWLLTAKRGDLLAVYKCPCCPGYHLTSKLDGEDAIACALPPRLDSSDTFVTRRDRRARRAR